MLNYHTIKKTNPMRKQILPVLFAGIVLIFGSCATKKNYLPESTPEAEGIFSEAILRFVNAIEIVPLSRTVLFLYGMEKLLQKDGGALTVLI